ncbi:uncharacterized protein BCR38DRAFT_412851 [Pseudomassariella vexata]|uniref:Uncharacterized protein n=1 Tax=Pseudomassariella vexata TaxID=1141098 RepID=A0A1Y2DIT3_9PEZI|nr:uncharacterized protein BCR38DRAFT_412851 [Pseudomassariella vexata]ORY59137.1 hypothetical protein BCR38DRAFT_412851 [Pseudomassariella vexata]
MSLIELQNHHQHGVHVNMPRGIPSIAQVTTSDVGKHYQGLRQNVLRRLGVGVGGALHKNKDFIKCRDISEMDGCHAKGLKQVVKMILTQAILRYGNLIELVILQHDLVTPKVSISVEFPKHCSTGVCVCNQMTCDFEPDIIHVNGREIL